jgi:hypothetical protein
VGIWPRLPALVGALAAALVRAHSATGPDPSAPTPPPPSCGAHMPTPRKQACPVLMRSACLGQPTHPDFRSHDVCLRPLPPTRHMWQAPLAAVAVVAGPGGRVPQAPLPPRPPPPPCSAPAPPPSASGAPRGQPPGPLDGPRAPAPPLAWAWVGGWRSGRGWAPSPPPPRSRPASGLPPAGAGTGVTAQGLGQGLWREGARQRCVEGVSRHGHGMWRVDGRVRCHQGQRDCTLVCLHA